MPPKKFKYDIEDFAKKTLPAFPRDHAQRVSYMVWLRAYEWTAKKHLTLKPAMTKWLADRPFGSPYRSNSHEVSARLKEALPNLQNPFLQDPGPAANPKPIPRLARNNLGPAQRIPVPATTDRKSVV